MHVIMSPSTIVPILLSNQTPTIVIVSNKYPPVQLECCVLIWGFTSVRLPAKLYPRVSKLFVVSVVQNRIRIISWILIPTYVTPSLANRSSLLMCCLIFGAHLK